MFVFFAFVAVIGVLFALIVAAALLVACAVPFVLVYRFFTK